MNQDVSTHDARPDERNRDLRVYVNGRIVPRAEAMVSVYDSGFLLGDGVWEGIRLHKGAWIFLDLHLDRLFEAARAIDLDVGMDRSGLRAALDETARANGMETDVHARLMITRGVKDKPFQDPRLSRQGPTLVIIMEHSRASASLRENGLKLASVPIHRSAPLAQDPKLNSHSKLNCVLAAIHAHKCGADEALMLDPHGFVNATNSCNFFLVREEDGQAQLWTSTGDYCMPGITRSRVLALSREAGIEAKEKNFSLSQAYGAKEAFATGSFAGLIPVREIDGRILPRCPGPVTLRLRSLYEALIEAQARRD